MLRGESIQNLQFLIAICTSITVKEILQNFFVYNTSFKFCELIMVATLFLWSSEDAYPHMYCEANDGSPRLQKDISKPEGNYAKGHHCKVLH